MPNAFEYEVFAEETDQGGKLVDSPIGGGSTESSQPGFVPVDNEKSPTVSFKDVDKDGDLDIVVSNQNGSQSYWVENTSGLDASELFSHPVFNTIIPTAMVSGDVNDDGQEDVVIGHRSGAKVFLSEGDNWHMENVGVRLSSPQTIVLADINRDGRTDILFRDTREVMLAMNSDGKFGAYTLSWPDLGSNNQLAVADFNLTNLTLEILTLNGDGVLSLASHDGSRWQPIQPVSSISMAAFEVIDLNDDGLIDVYVQEADGSVMWLENDGDGGVIVHDSDDITSSVVVESAVVPSTGDVTTYDAGESVRPVMNTLDSTSEAETEDNDTSSDGNDALLYRCFYSALSSDDDWGADSEPERVELSFDFDVQPEIDFTYDSETTRDYSHSSYKMDVHLDSGFSIGYGKFWFFDNFPRSFDAWWNKDAVVNVIGSNKDDTIDGSDADNYLFGGNGNDYIYGEAGDDTILGGSGRDVLAGDAGDDVIFGDNGNDAIYGGHGDDLAYGGSGNDVLFGFTGDDTLLGGSGNDTIYGDSDNDLIHGGLGADELYGGSGSDTFHYSSAEEGNDIIKDFTVGEDLFVFDFGSYEFREVSSPYTGDGGDRGEVFVWESTGDGEGKLYFDADGSTAGDETLIATVDLDGDAQSITMDDIGLT